MDTTLSIFHRDATAKMRKDVSDTCAKLYRREVPFVLRYTVKGITVVPLVY